MGRVVITGSSGIVGSAVAAELHASGWTVLGWDARPGRWTDHVGDLRDPALRARALAGADAVVHAAALHAPHVGRVPDEDFRSVNVEATAALLDQAVRCGVRRFVYTSSTSVYGHALVPRDRAVWVDETLDPLPRDIYDETKLAAETLVRAHEALSPVVLRIARCFPEPRPIRAAHRLHRGVDPRDVAQAHRMAVDRAGVDGVFTIAGPVVFTRSDVEELWRDAAAVLGRRAPELVAVFERNGWPVPERIDRVYDSSAATAKLGYRPVHGAASVAAA
ncbi:NAD-dependent epimerase/dehydratase family protein [Actinokineospora fastidiosa]|uniref:NAD-dependent epimerase n=1 Tax=Actinokineospora fastidiosa TaxID=1816 RepID=A0A918LIA0_9PSEU|nr:NAD(P)-dependent oxidoreductase [Actinokineospora fastidiosa]GGS51464.1 NAD-dependent epimerase [Actinokineospora fastidiosa]